MLTLIVRRLLLAVPLLIVVTGASFVLLALVPGSAADVLLGNNATAARVAALNKQLGLDQPLFVQYWHWLDGVLHGHLGTSVITGQSVLSTLNQRLPVTIALVVGALIVAFVVGVALGTVSAVRGGRLGRAVDGISVLGFAVPNFWLALLLVSVFAVKLHWLPASGYVSFSASPGQFFRSLALPVIALGAAGATGAAKQTRDAMLDVMGRDYILSLRASGMPKYRIILRHALPNALIPTLTLMGLFAVSLLGGAALIEDIFVLPGLGGLAVSSAGNHDLPMMEGITLYFTIVVIALNLLVDILCGLLDPRIRLARS
jgi:peptide/nickel transport system permease protein